MPGMETTPTRWRWLTRRSGSHRSLLGSCFRRRRVLDWMPGGGDGGGAMAVVETTVEQPAEFARVMFFTAALYIKMNEARRGVLDWMPGGGDDDGATAVVEITVGLPAEFARVMLFETTRLHRNQTVGRLKCPSSFSPIVPVFIFLALLGCAETWSAVLITIEGWLDDSSCNQIVNTFVFNLIVVEFSSVQMKP